MRGVALERRVALFTAVAIVATVGYLVVRNEPFRDPNLVVLFRTVLSLATGLLGATIPGFLNIKYSFKGFAIRAGGALALFVLTFVYTPRVESLNLSAAELELDRIRVVDIRTSLGPERAEADRAQAPAFVTVPVAIRSSMEPALRATVSKSSVRLKTAKSSDLDFSWRYFVTMHEERHGVWLGIDDDAHPFTVEAGGVVFHEILHEPTTEITWARLLTLFEPGGASRLEVILNITADGRELESRCTTDLNYWRAQVQDFIKSNGATPSRITMKCLDNTVVGG